MTIKAEWNLICFFLLLYGFLAIAAPSHTESIEQEVQSYIENYPYIVMVKTCKKMTNPILFGEIPGAAPFGTFFHGKRLLDYRDRLIVNPNHETMMSAAWVNLTDGAKYLLIVPPLPKNRYFSVAIHDLWTNVLKIISARTVTDDSPQKIILIGPSGKVNKNEEPFTVKSPTDVVWILVRILAKEEKDIPKVMELQKKVQLIRLTPGDSKNDASACSLNETQKKLLQSPEYKVIKKKAEAEFEKALFKSHARINGWNSNFDFSKTNATLRRAAIAFDGLGALPSSEAVYFATDVDFDNQQLLGSRCYKIHFDEMPPVDAFWSLSVYDKKTAFFEKNSIDRYSVGSNTKGLLYNDDCSFDIILQHDKPAENSTNSGMNWLPAPAGECFIVLRLYHPRKEILDGTYQPPKIERIK